MRRIINHIDRQIPPLAHTPMYLWHKYWARKTWNVVGQFIETYCPKEGIVCDPFCGSGITAMEALKRGRKAIVCDLNPIATGITRLTIKPVSEVDLHNAFERVAAKVRTRIEELYLTRCRNCGKDIVFDCAIWHADLLKEIRYQECAYCGDRRAKDCPPTPEDIRRYRTIESQAITAWYPKDRLYYPDGRPFKKKEKYNSVDELFPRRNLLALALLMEAIQQEDNPDLQDFLKIAFSSIVHLCSRMIAISNPIPTSHHTPFSSTGWTQHSYWSTQKFMEQNVWHKFDSAINGHQGLLKAKVESNGYFSNIKIARSLDHVFSSKADVYIYTGSCLDLMDEMEARSVDYIFTDPPYDASIQYGELSFMWVAWLRLNNNYVHKIIDREIVRNEEQHKDFQVYYSLLSSSFEKMHRVLKTNGYLTVTFHNPTFKVRNATIRAGVFAGFEFQKIHHQPLGQSSAKALLQPFGSAQGDFYLRFFKPPVSAHLTRPEEIDEARFEKIVVETTIALLAERAEPTPYTMIINFIDPVLARHGFFGSLSTGLDVNSVLRKHLNKEFILLPTRLGSAEGKLWWFKDTTLVARLNEIPLTERVEQTVYRKLHQRGRVTFTDVWDGVSTEFPNSLTSDSTSILDALKIYARKTSGGYWMLKPEIRHRVNQHSEIVGILAIIGKAQGFDVWVGKREQRETDSGLVASGKRLREYMTIKKLSVANARNQKVIENLDLIWIKGKKIHAVFEVESTTSMTSALLRGSNVDVQVEKYMVVPEEREAQFRTKMTSPLFKEHFERDGWQIIYFDCLRNAYQRQKTRLNLRTIVGKKTSENMRREQPECKQELLF